MTRARGPLALLLGVAGAIAASGPPARAQAVSQRGFVEGVTFVFPQTTVNDTAHVVADGLAREEVFLKPADWLQFAAGLDLRVNSHDQVEPVWRLDFGDRGVLRPRLSARRLTATIIKSRLTVDIGKQFIRWGKTDILTPTDRFAPRDYINVIASELLPVAGVRSAFQNGNETLEGVWVPRVTPSRLPLVDQRWATVPEQATGLPIIDAGSMFPHGSQVGARWSHVGAGFESSLSFFSGFNNLPTIEANVANVANIANVASRPNLEAVPQALVLIRTYPAIRGYGADAAVPTRWFTVKIEAEYLTSRATDPAQAVPTDDYLLYVLQLERQSGEWVLVGGYAGEVVTKNRAAIAFSPDRGFARLIVGRASYTIDPRRSLAVEAAVHQNGDGLYAKFEYSETRGQHWRVTLNGVGIAGEDTDFLGQYHRNSNVSVAVRYSF